MTNFLKLNYVSTYSRVSWNTQADSTLLHIPFIFFTSRFIIFMAESKLALFSAHPYLLQNPTTRRKKMHKMIIFFNEWIINDIVEGTAWHCPSAFQWLIWLDCIAGKCDYHTTKWEQKHTMQWVTLLMSLCSGLQWNLGCYNFAQ